MKISGKVSLSSFQTSSGVVNKQSCLPSEVYLHPLDNNGHRLQKELARATVSSDGSFIFTASIPFQPSMLLAKDCNSDLLLRPLTGNTHQDINWGTSVLSYVLNTGQRTQVLQVLRQEPQALESFLREIPIAANAQEAYEHLVSNPSIRNQFQKIFSVSPEILTSSAPEIVSIKAPSEVFEEESFGLAVEAHHWNTDYSAISLWRLEEQQIGQGPTLSYTPHGNQQGEYDLHLVVGQDDGFGNIDGTQPTQILSQKITVRNNIQPTPPDFQVVWPVTAGSAPINTRVLTIEIETGMNSSNCSSFSALAISEEGGAPTAESFNIVCNGNPSQTLPWTLASPGDGIKLLTLWARDAAGVVSLVPKNFSLTLDTTPPQVEILVKPAVMSGLSSASFSFLAVDGASSDVVSLYCRLDDGDFEACMSPQVYSGLSEGSHQFFIKAIDAAGNESLVASENWVIDLTPPGLTFAVPSADELVLPVESLQAVPFSGTCSEEERSVDLRVGVLTASATCRGGGWETQLDLGALLDGRHVLTATLTDQAGHIASVERSFIKDTKASILTLSPPLALRGNGLYGEVAWTLSEEQMGSGENFLVEIYDGSSWISAGSLPAMAGPQDAQSYQLSGFPVPNINIGNAQIRISVKDAAGNIASVTSENFAIDSSPPTLGNMTINDGATFAGTPLLGVKLEVADNMSTVLQVRFTETSESGECQALYADNNWVPWVNSASAVTYLISPVDSTKKVCAWAKDEVGNVSVMNPPLCSLGQDCDTIIFETGNPPAVNLFSVSRFGGGNEVQENDPIEISWAIEDFEGLDNNPISFSYTTDNIIWKDLTTNKDVSISQNITWLGGLSGNPKNASGSFSTWTSPTDGFLRLRAVAKDQAGNLSVAALSQGMNLGRWSFWAGSQDLGDGGTATSAALTSSGANHYNMTVDPVRGDIYIVDYANYSIRRLDVKTGIINTFSSSDVTNLLATGGALPENLKIKSPSSMSFDNKGHLYVQDASFHVYQINVQTKTYRRYISYGSSYGVAATAQDVVISQGTPLVFDEDNSLYFFGNCKNEIIHNVVTPKRIFKVLQNADSTAGELTIVAGNCGNGEPASGATALTSPLNTDPHQQGISASLVVLERGNVIYYGHYSNPTFYKIINGVIYHTNMSTTGHKIMRYNPVDQKLYYRNNSMGVSKGIVNKSGNGGENPEPVVTTSYSPGCTANGISISDACINLITMHIDRSGTLYFLDGPITNSKARLRYVDPSGKVRTVIGTLPYYGDGLDRLLARGSFRGIYYKQSSEENQEAFPSGLYFVDNNAMVFGYISPLTRKTEILWGDQARLTTPSDGVTISKNSDMGAIHPGGGGASLAFDDSGLPWLRSNFLIYKIDANKKLVKLQNTNTYYFEDAAENSSPTLTSLGYYGGVANLVLKNSGVFLIGGRLTTSRDPVAKIQYLDFAADKVKRVMGGTTVTISMDSPGSADIPLPGGGVQNAPLLKSCSISNNCYLQYRKDQDRLYFSEGNKFRYITTPDNSLTSTLITEFVLPAGNIRNFIFTSDGSQLWYFKDNYGLYCRDFSSGKSWCDDSTDYNTLRDVVGNFEATTNGMTWIDSTTLLISPGNGAIYQFKLPTGP